MRRLSRDIRQGARALRKRPAFTATATLTLALGIGLSSAVFTVGHTLLLKRLPVQDEDRLVVLWGKKPSEEFNYPLDLDAARSFAEQARTLRGVGSFAYEGASPVLIRDGDRVSRLHRALVSGNFFQVLGAQPVLGRTLRPADDVWGAERRIVLSHDSWRVRFGGDSGVIGRRLTLHEDGGVYTVVGVMPAGLDVPRGTDFWAAAYAVIPEGSLQYAAVNLIGRLAPGATDASARGELTAFFARPDGSGWMRDLRAVTVPLPALILGDARPALVAFAAAAGLLLLIASLNVANLLLVRGVGRAREMAVRAAIGAGRRDLVRQLLTENALLALAGGVLGALVAVAAVQAFVALAPESTPRLSELSPGLSVVMIAFFVSLLALMCFGVVPALSGSRRDLHNALRADARQTGAARSRLMTEGLVAAQVALALLVLSAAALIARSLVNLQRADFAFDTSGLLIAELALRYDQLDAVDKQRAAIGRLLPAIERLPQVRSLSPVVAAPFAGSGGWDGRPAKEGQTTQDAASNPMLNMEVVSPRYFETVGMPVLQGRSFAGSDREGAPPVVVLSVSAARYYWPGQNPLGRRLMMGAQLDRSFTVIGIVPDTRYRDLSVARPSIYFPLTQAFFPFTATTLAIATRGDQAAAISAIREAVNGAEPGIALAAVAPFGTFLDKPLGQPRLNTLLLGVFALACVSLSAIGLYGVMATMVRARTREFGVRMALGATPGNVRGMVIRRGLAIAGIGLVTGLSTALLANRLLVALLHDVTPTDPATLLAVAIFLLAVAALANLLPARAGARISVASTLRVDA